MWVCSLCDGPTAPPGIRIFIFRGWDCYGYPYTLQDPLEPGEASFIVWRFCSYSAFFLPLNEKDGYKYYDGTGVRKLEEAFRVQAWEKVLPWSSGAEKKKDKKKSFTVVTGQILRWGVRRLTPRIWVKFAWIFYDRQMLAKGMHGSYPKSNTLKPRCERRIFLLAIYLSVPTGFGRCVVNYLRAVMSRAITVGGGGGGAG